LFTIQLFTVALDLGITILVSGVGIPYTQTDTRRQFNLFFYLLARWWIYLCRNSLHMDGHQTDTRQTPGRHWIGGERGRKGGAMRAYQKWFCVTLYYLVIADDQEG
jgi:hypothetical protein